MSVQITIVGLGQIGASVGLALGKNRSDIRRVGHDKDPSVSRKAKKIGAVDDTKFNLPAAVRKTDIVLLSLPVNEIRAALEVIAPDLPEGAVVLDTAPTQTSIAEWAQEILPEGCHYVGLVPAINPDVTIIHVQAADAQGTVRIGGLPFADVEQAKAARHLIVTCETVAATDQLRHSPDQNQIPFFCVDAVVHLPMGAWPTACYRHYDYDPAQLHHYRQAALDDERYAAYLQDEIYATADHEQMLARVDALQLEKIRADERTGYAVGLDRR